MKKYFLLFTFILICSFFAGCHKNEDPPPDPQPLPMEDIAYGSHPRQTMDISLPLNAGSGNEVPVVMCIHGGSWSGGDKEDFDWIKRSVNDYNCAYVTINYRLVQDNVTYREMLDDVHKAISYLKTHSDSYHLKTDRMALLGSSAGGHLALLYSYTVNSPIPIACVSSQVGPADFLDPGQIAMNGREKLDLMNKLLGTRVSYTEFEQPGFIFPESWTLASPIYHVSNDSPPTVLAYGMRDELVSYTNALRLNDTLEAYGVDHRLILYPNSGHGLNNDPDKSTEYWRTLIQYVNTYLLR